MGKRNRKSSDYVYNEIYSPWLRGGLTNNPANNRMAIRERMYRRILTEMSVARFKWIGLPSSIDERFLELMLFRNGLVAWYFDHEITARHYALRATAAGPLNMYDNPVGYRVYGNATFTGKNLTTDPTRPDFCVPIWSNALRTPDNDIVMLYAADLADMDTTIRINSRNARRSKVVVADENARLSATNINNQIDSGEPTIFLNSAGRDLLNNFTAVDLGVHPDSIEKLQIARGRLWNEVMGLLGLNFANQDKRERMVVDEVNANDEQVSNMRAVALNQRKKAAREINRQWNLNIDVKFNVDLPRIVENTMGEL